MKCQECGKNYTQLFYVSDTETNEIYLLHQKDIITENTGRDEILATVIEN